MSVLQLGTNGALQLAQPPLGPTRLPIHGAFDSRLDHVASLWARRMFKKTCIPDLAKGGGDSNSLVLPENLQAGGRITTPMILDNE